MLQDLLSKYATEAEKQAYLRQLVKEHPYFTPAQFCLLQNTPASDAAYQQQAATTALLFHNTGWLNYQLHHKDKETAAPVSPADEPVLEQTNIIIPAKAATSENLPDTNTPETVDTVPENNHTNNHHTNTVLAIEKEVTPLPIPGPARHDSDLLFEPLYAVDYFASQGIKLSDELQPGDKLGKQLKSFTEWLKSMKKTQAQAAEGTAATTDPAIEFIAEKSNKEGEVVTEAMALVYAQQGNIKKAIGIYQKLSLLNPLKSAYFAAKIENLK